MRSDMNLIWELFCQVRRVKRGARPSVLLPPASLTG
jgi:hypothetical protein